jgi:acyl-CoA thioesterase-1
MRPRYLPALWAFAAVALVLLPAGCRRARDSGPERTPPASRSSSTTSGPLVVFLGDSLTAGLNIDEGQAYPALVERLLRDDGYAVRVQNAGVSGDTAAGGLRRLAWVLRQKPDVVVVALGGNDGLRGLDLATLEESLREILTGIRASGAKALLVGMKIPPSMGATYARRFEEIYTRLAREQRVPLVPFLLEGVAGHDDLLLPDGIHPKPEGHRIMAKTVLPYVRELVGGAVATSAPRAP